MIKVNPAIFHAYDIRGIYPAEINPETAYRIAWAFGKYLKNDLSPSPLTLSRELRRNVASEGRGGGEGKVVLGMDMRGSSPFLAREVIRGLNDQGLDVVEIGKVPTPAFYYAIAFKDFAGGVMVTASHNPKEYNGFKFCGPKASPIGQGTGLEKIQAYAEEEPGKPAGKGQLQSLANVTQEYVNQDLSYLNTGKIKPLKIAADPANAMGSLYLEELFKRIPGDLIRVNWELNGNMPVHEANPLKTETLRQLQELIKNEQADFGIATDGDGDRLAFLDEKAEIIPPQTVTELVMKNLQKKYPNAKSAFNPSNFDMEDLIFTGQEDLHYRFRENFYFPSPVFVISQLLALRSETSEPFSGLKILG